MPRLRLVVDAILDPSRGEVGRYAAELGRELIASAPKGIEVEGLVSASPTTDYARIHDELPSLSELHKSSLDRRALHGLWRRGLTSSGGGMLHAPDLLAPIAKHDRLAKPGEQTVVTVHDTLAWTAPERLPKGEAALRVAMLRRAAKYADAVIAPSHAVADALSAVASFGDRVRVIAGGASSRTEAPADAEHRVAALGLPDEYLLAWSTGESAKASIGQLLRGMTRTDGPTLPIVVFATNDVRSAAAELGLAQERLHVVDPADSADRATVLHRATVLVHPGPAEGFGLPILDAMAAGVPVIHADDEALEELTADAALVVSRNDVAGFTASLAQHIAALLEDTQTRERMRIAGRDRAQLYSWRDAAEKVWQLHADL